MKAAVVYCSKTGNTKKVAEAIAKVLGTKAKSVEEKVDLHDCDLICVGTGVHAFRPERGMTTFIKNLTGVEGKKGAVFGTYSGLSSFLGTLESMLKSKGVEVIDKWGCKGEFIKTNRGKPDKDDLEKARDFAKALKERLS